MATRNTKVTATGERINVPGDDDPVDVPVDILAGADAPTQDGVDEAPPPPAKFVAVHDVVGWREPVPDTNPVRYKTRRVFIGQALPSSLPASERDRLLEAGGIAAAGRDAAEALAAKADGGRPTVAMGEVGDNELSGWAQPNLIAYVTQFPTEAERVNRIERSRPGGPREAIVRAAGYDPETGDRLE